MDCKGGDSLRTITLAHSYCVTSTACLNTRLASSTRSGWRNRSIAVRARALDARQVSACALADADEMVNSGVWLALWSSLQGISYKGWIDGHVYETFPKSSETGQILRRLGHTYPCFPMAKGDCPPWKAGCHPSGQNCSRTIWRVHRLSVHLKWACRSNKEVKH